MKNPLQLHFWDSLVHICILYTKFWCWLRSEICFLLKGEFIPIELIVKLILGLDFIVLCHVFFLNVFLY